MDLIDYPDAEMMMMRLADILASEINTCLAAHDHASLAVPGGTTPGPVFDTLSGAALAWDRVHVLLTDERCVPPDHPRSNERLLRERLLRDRAAAATYMRIGQDDLAAELPLSILLLGMGTDMHIASLFPGSPDLAAALAADAPPTMRVRASGDLEDRITLTGPTLRGAMSTHVVLIGAEKRAALDRARGLSPAQAPINVVLNAATVHWALS